MKSKKFWRDLKANYNDQYFVENALFSQNAMKCMYAIRSCVINNFRGEKIVNRLKELKYSTLVEWNSCKISNCALAALHLMSIETYRGNDGQVNDLIDTVFFTKL